MTTEKKRKTVFINGPVTAQFIAEAIAAHSKKKGIGAHSIFLGQVRNDLLDAGEVQAIEYTAYPEMAEEGIDRIREETFAKYTLTCMHIYHSLGRVNAGEICLFVFTSSRHRDAATAACTEIVERIKKEIPVWGKELFTDSSFRWKTNNEHA